MLNAFVNIRSSILHRSPSCVDPPIDNASIFIVSILSILRIHLHRVDPIDLAIDGLFEREEGDSALENEGEDA